MGIDPTKHAVRGWYYDPDKEWWYHLHKIGIWHFRRKYLVPTTHGGVCEKCGKQVPADLQAQVRK